MIQRPNRQPCYAKPVATEQMGARVTFEATERNRQGQQHGTHVRTSQGHANYADSITDEGMTKFQPVPAANHPTNNFFGKCKT